eukprot:jgi/Botrbrau1/17907/Bobra.50_1s0008.1
MACWAPGLASQDGRLLSTVPLHQPACAPDQQGDGRVRRETMYREHNMDHPRVNPVYGIRAPPARLLQHGLRRARCPALLPRPLRGWTPRQGSARCGRRGRAASGEELLFVPGPAGETVEDDGHLLGMVYDNELQLSSLVVLDAKDFNKGPLARIWLKHHVPHGLHGQFTPSYFGPN